MSTIKPLTLNICVDKIQFDPNDEQTQNFSSQSVIYQIYQDFTHIANIYPFQNDSKNCQFALTADFFQKESVVRIIAKDTNLCIKSKPSNGVNDDIEARVGTISFNSSYFSELNPDLFGKQLTQWITIFDDVEDDDFDGEFAEDDEELPLIRVQFQVQELKNQITPVQIQLNEAIPSPQKNYQTQQSQSNANQKKVPQLNTANVASSNNPSFVNQYQTNNTNYQVSPTRPPQQQRRKTVITQSGTKKVVLQRKLSEDANQISPSPRIGEQPTSAKIASRRKEKQQKTNEAFGDFFGFGPNPPGALSKNCEPIDIKKEKEKFINLLIEETKRYDIQGMHTELNQKSDNIVAAIRKEHRNIINDEERQLRNLDKLEYMSQYLSEDHINTSASLQSAFKIREKSKQEMQEFENLNQKELKDLEDLVKNMQKTIELNEQQQIQIKNENLRLLQAIQDGRKNDQQQNQNQIEQIHKKDQELDKIEKDIHALMQQRQKNLNKFNQECEQASIQTQKTENLLKDKEQQRQKLQEEKEQIEKKLAELTQESFKEQSINYQLNYRHKYLTQKSQQAEQKVLMLQQKLKYMTSTLSKQIRDQAEHANEVDVETKKLKMELERKKEEVQLKNNELKKLEDLNAETKKAQYDREIEKLSRKLQNVERQRIEMQTKLENAHTQWSCKLQIFVTDMKSQSEKTKNDLLQVNELLQQMASVCDKQESLLQQRQNLLLENFEQAEKQELTNHLQGQIQDCDQMIEDTKEQIKEIQVQIEKINGALTQRQQVINDQIQQLNVFRQQKVDLDKQIQLQSSQITDLNRHIERLDADIERLTQDKEILIERLNELSQNVAQKIDEIEDIELLLKDKDKIIEILNRKIREKQKKPVFQIPKGDLLDQLLSQYINAANCPVPIRKIGSGFYLFGTKKIFAKILNAKLVIRVGGGFMIIEEFIATYAENEMRKINNLTEEQLIALHSESKEVSTQINPNARLSLYRNNASNNRKSTTPSATQIAVAKNDPKQSISSSIRAQSTNANQFFK